MTIYERIKQRREELGMSQEELARKLNYKSRSTLAKIESGLCDITTSKLLAFANALDVPIEWLMGTSVGFYTDLERKAKEFPSTKKQLSVDIAKDVEDLVKKISERAIKEYDNPYKTFLAILFADRPDIVNAIKSMTAEGEITFGDMICQLDAQKIDFIRNSVIMSFEQAKLNGRKAARINVTKGEIG